MNTIVLNKRTIDHFFSFLSHLDINSKKRLIIKLTESIDELKKNKNSLKSLFGSWIDNRDSDLIIKEIIDSRVNNPTIVEF